MALPADFLERLRSMNRIDDVMSSYVTLKRAGRTSKCLCPFHSEKTPSCVVYPDTESFYCFGCGAGGDVISFVMQIENLSYIEAVKLLAQKSGMAMPEDSRFGDDGIAKKKQRLYDMNKAAAKFFYKNLKTEKGKKGLEYLLNRGLKPETIKKFGLGVATNSWNDLKYHLLGEGFTEQELIDGSLITVSGKTNGTFDFFMDRVMFPFFDLRGNIIAFGGRALGTEDSRKYLNSKETLVFQKNRTLFCLNYAKNLAAKKKQILLCEGNMDVISLHQSGFENAVATCGTAITPEHARLMSQYCDEVIICYDSDEAGQKATQKALNILSDVGINTRVIKMQGAKDPDEFIQKFGPTAFQNLLDNSDGAINFELLKCKNGLDLDSDIGKVEYLKRCFNVLADIKSPIEREVYISRVSAENNVAKGIVEQEVVAAIRKKERAEKKREWNRTATFADAKRDKLNPNETLHRREVKAEKGILSYIFFNPDKAGIISDMLKEERFISDINRKIYKNLIEKIKNGDDFSISSFHGEFSPEEMGKISEIIALSKEHPESWEAVSDYIDVLNNHTIGAENNGSEFSDDDFLAFAEKMRSKKQ
ncbi:MAG: DNA primase [Oscillospiraceae bacterium]|nr:DNA primase [Oscillospiraceae bacterium]